MRPKSGTTTGLLVLLVLSLAAYPVRGDVYIMTRTYNLDPIPDLGADFGPDVPDEGLEGQLRVADPEDACKPLVFKDLDTIWVALIARQQQFHPTMNCTFDIKVRHAQEAGAAAAIVYDDEYESLIIMSKPRGHPDPLIPSVFVTQKAGILMKKLLALEQEDGVRVRITPVSAVAWIGMVLSAVLGLLALTVVFSTFYILRSWSLWLSSGTTPPTGPRPPGAPAALAQPQRNTDTGLPPHVLRALPVLIYESQPPSRTRSLPNSMQHSQAAGSALEAAVAAEEAEGGLWLHGTSPTDADNKLPQSHQHAWRQGGADQGVRGGSVTGDSSSNSSEFEEQMRPVGVHAGETKRVCTVCLESYVEGDKLRVLPCHHRFHMQCIDQWLSNRRLCPVCKHDASKPLLQPHPRPRDQSPQAGAAAASAPEAGSGSSLVSTLANMRRAWRSRRSTQEQQPEEAAEAGMHSRRVAMRARLLRWLPMMRPFQRQALLAALNSQLTEPLLLNTATETTGTTETTTNSTNQQQGQGGAAASRPGRSAGPAGTAAGAAGADVDLEAGTQQPLGAGSGGVQQEPPTPQAGAAALNTLIAAGGGAAAAAAAAAGAGAAATGAGGGAAAAGAGAAPLIVQAVPVSRRSPGLGGPGGGGSTAADSSTRSV